MELVVSLAITGVVGVFLASFLGNQVALYHSLSRQDSARSASIGIFNAVQEQIAHGKDFSVEEDTLTFTLVKKGDVFPGETIDGQRLGDQLFPNLSREGMHAVLSFHPQGKAVLVTVTIEEKEGEEEIYSFTQTVPCPNVGLIPTS